MSLFKKITDWYHKRNKPLQPDNSFSFRDEMNRTDEEIVINIINRFMMELDDLLPFFEFSPLNNQKRSTFISELANEVSDAVRTTPREGKNVSSLLSFKSSHDELWRQHKRKYDISITSVRMVYNIITDLDIIHITIDIKTSEGI